MGIDEGRDLDLSGYPKEVLHGNFLVYMHPILVCPVIKTLENLLSMYLECGLKTTDRSRFLLSLLCHIHPPVTLHSPIFCQAKEYESGGNHMFR